MSVKMNRKIHTSIQREYENLREDAKRSLDVRINEVYGRFSELHEIDTNIAKLSLNYNKNVLLGGRGVDSLEELSESIEKLKDKKEQILISNGFPAAYLEVSYECSPCKDTGFIELPSGSFEKCNCYRQKLINHVYSSSNLNALQIENFSAFDECKFSDEINEPVFKIPASPKQNILGIRKKVIEFIENFSGSSQKGMLFTGKTGLGKTFMANCIAKELIDRGFTVLYLSSPQLFHIIKNYLTAGWDAQEVADDSYNFILESELLIIDDLGIEPVTKSRYAELLTI
ncbi:MAG: ATP-binding protein, partial [bacterium]